VDVFCCFDGFPDVAGMADVDVGYNVYSVENAISWPPRVLGTADHWFFSLVSLICSEILVDM
jgi:hypothetical protein